MAVTIEALRGYGTRRIVVHCSDGSFDGSIVSKELSEHSVMLLFKLHGAPDTPIVIDVADISQVVER